MAPSAPSVVLDAQTLTGICTRALTHVGVPAEDAALAAETFVRSESEGAVSHGVARLAPLVRRIRAGSVAADAELQVLTETPTTAVLDAHDGIAQVAAARAMLLAVSKALDHGLGAVTVRNSGNLGRAGHPALLAARRGMIGIAASNASPRVVSGPGMRPILGNNPWAVAMPTGGHPIVVDMANSIVAAGKIRAAKAEGESIPEGWATDADGQSTTDPGQALTGALLAFGGHKGWALSLIVDALSGVLSGGAFGGDVGPPDDLTRPQRSAHFFLALQVEAFLPLKDFQRRMDELAGRLREAGGPDARLPGERSAQLRAPRLTDGVPVRHSAVRAIDEVLREVGLEGWDAVLQRAAHVADLGDERA